MHRIHFTKPSLIDSEIENLREKPASYWEKQGEERVIELTKYVYETTPAYRDFLAKNGARVLAVDSIDDFKKLPIIDKESYLRKHDYLDLFPNRTLEDVTTISATSGSTGEPFYFPRGEVHDAQYEYIAEIFLKNQFETDKRKTLGIIGFAFGVWIGGIFTYKNLNKIASQGHTLSLLPVGTNKDMFIRAVEKFGSLYEQIIIMGYPPFIKDVLDEGAERGLNWARYNVKILTAAEGFTERFKQYLAEKAGLENVYRDKINMYGSVELGTMAHETALSSLIRKIAHDNDNVFETLFPRASSMPTFAQFYPHLIYFEEADGEVIASGYGSSIPLIRYRFSDLGGVLRFDDVIEKLQSCGIDIVAEAQKAQISHTIFKLPFVYLYGRADHVVIFRGANIYPGEIKTALDNPELRNAVTGKFTMIRREDIDLSQKLEINVELKQNVTGSTKLEEQIKNIIVEELRTNNSEYKNEYDSDPIRTAPIIILWPYQHETHFGGSGKQKWVKS